MNDIPEQIKAWADAAAPANHQTTTSVDDLDSRRITHNHHSRPARIQRFRVVAVAAAFAGLVVGGVVMAQHDRGNPTGRVATYGTAKGSTTAPVTHDAPGDPNAGHAALPLCDALRASVPGIDEIVWDNGITSGEATWGTLLESGILNSDAATRSAAASAVRADTEGFDRILGAAPESLRPDLERLRSLLLDPDEVEARRADPVIVESIQKVIEASPPEVCGWVR